MGSTTIRSILKKPAVVGYRCSKCGKVQQFVYNIVAQGESHGMGSAWGSVKRSMEEQARDLAKQKMEEIEEKLKTELPAHNYSHAQIPTRRCTSCGNIEPWMPKPNLIFRIILGICLIGCIVSFIVGLILSGTDKNEISKVFLIIAGILFAGQIVTAIVLKAKGSIDTKKRENIVASLPEDSLPIISSDLDEYYRLAKAKFADDTDAMKELEEVYKEITTSRQS